MTLWYSVTPPNLPRITYPVTNLSISIYPTTLLHGSRACNALNSMNISKPLISMDAFGFFLHGTRPSYPALPPNPPLDIQVCSYPTPRIHAPVATARLRFIPVRSGCAVHPGQDLLAEQAQKGSGYRFRYTAPIRLVKVKSNSVY